jgi:hypothetical protein
MKRAADRRAAWAASAVIAAALAVSPIILSPAEADECVTTASSTAEVDFTPCDSGPFVNFNDIPVDPTGRATAAPDGTPWIAESGKGVPLTLNSSDTGVSMRTSLGTWRDYNTQAATMTLAPSQIETSPVPFALPKTAAPKLPLDVWSSVDVQGLEGSRDQSTRTGVGADYTFGKATIVGVSVERGDARTATSAEEDAKASAYITLKPTPMLSLDARTEWEGGNAGFAAATGAAQRNSVVLSPRLDHSFDIDGNTLQPFVTYSRAFDLSTAGRNMTETGLESTQSVGAGVTYSKPDAYSLSVSTDVDGTSATTPASVNSKFQLSVPIR